jgi:outer membrane lipoprotein carrier protein
MLEASMRRSRLKSASRRIGTLSVLSLLLLQGFADLTIAKEKAKAAPKKFSATEKVAKQPVLPKAVLPQELVEVEKTYLKAKTLEADFTQKDEVKMTGSKKESSGVLMIRHPNQFRWETLRPDKNLLVTDGRKFWFYTPPFEAGERGQVIEKKTTEVQSELANAVLAGSFSKIRGVEIQKLSPTKFRLVPAEGVAGSVKTAEIDLDPVKGIVQRLQLEHVGGNRTEISLANVKLSGKLNDQYFKFTTPPGTDVVRE